VLNKVNASITDPLAINAFIGASVGNLTIDDTLTEGDLFNIAQDFRGLPTSHLITETLPTTSLVTDGGADVLQEAQPYAQNMINAFNAIGTAPPATPVAKSSSSTTTTTSTTLPHGKVGVDVLNASSVNGLARFVAGALAADGFTIDQVGNATTALSGTDSEILYGPDGLRAAQTLDASLHGPVTMVATPGLTGSAVQLLVAGTTLTVASPSANRGSNGTGTGSATNTSTTTSTSASTTTTTTIPGDVYTNTQSEPWNPYPCTSGATTQAAPKTTTTMKKGEKAKK
jgi:hypothetical protein